MKKLMLATAVAVIVGACAPTTTLVCDRESQVWNKFGTQEDECHVQQETRPSGNILDRFHDDPDRDRNHDRSIGDDRDTTGADDVPDGTPDVVDVGPDDHDAGDDSPPANPDVGGDEVNEDKPGDSGNVGDSDGDGGHTDDPVDDHPDTSLGNPGNHKDVGRAGENPNNKGGWGEGDRGMSNGNKGDKGNKGNKGKENKR